MSVGMTSPVRHREIAWMKFRVSARGQKCVSMSKKRYFRWGLTPVRQTGITIFGVSVQTKVEEKIYRDT
jgi:hypothetical protein